MQIDPAPPPSMGYAESSLTTATCEQKEDEMLASFTPLLAYDTRLYNLAFRILDNREDALDVVQHVYQLAFQHHRIRRAVAEPYSWLCRITMSECARRGLQHDARRQREFESVEWELCDRQ